MPSLQRRIHMKAKDGAGGPAGAGDAIVYSKFDFSAIEKQKKNKNKDYKQLLAKVWNQYCAMWG